MNQYKSVKFPVLHIDVVLCSFSVDILLSQVHFVLPMGQIALQKLKHLLVVKNSRVAENPSVLFVGVEKRIPKMTHQLQQSELVVADGPKYSPR